MLTALLFLEFIGTTELLVIALVALIIFGPRKLPEIGRTVGRSLAEFKRASEDFKRTWEYEVEVEQTQKESRVESEARAARRELLDADPSLATPENATPYETAGASSAQPVARGAIEEDSDESPESQTHERAPEQI